MDRVYGCSLGGSLRLVVAFVFAATLAAPVAAPASPPPHAPAHGWRAKHRHTSHPGRHGDDHRHGDCRGYTGHPWPRDYGIYGGSCRRAEIGAVLGGVVGGAIGSTVGSGSDRAVAILVGGILGAVVGQEIGRAMDESDRACFGHSLELADTGRSITWRNEATGLTYVVTPTGGTRNGEACRTFRLREADGGRSNTTNGRACRAPDGTWRMRPI